METFSHYQLQDSTPYRVSAGCLNGPKTDEASGVHTNNQHVTKNSVGAKTTIRSGRVRTKTR